MTILRKRRAVQKLLGTALPDGTDDLHYFRWQPSEDLSYYVAYVKFGASREEFIDLMQRMDMDFHHTGGDANLYLPAAWDAEVELEWWDPDPDTPVNDTGKCSRQGVWYEWLDRSQVRARSCLPDGEQRRAPGGHTRSVVKAWTPSSTSGGRAPIGGLTSRDPGATVRAVGCSP
jgi:hypothetical protein